MLAYRKEVFHWDGDLVYPGGDSGHASAKEGQDKTARLDASNKQHMNPTKAIESPGNEDSDESSGRGPAEPGCDGGVGLSGRMFHPDPHPDATYTKLPCRAGRKTGFVVDRYEIRQYL